ncbi:MAG: EAL domain-containing protein [Lachnospirales bacterium]
MKKSQSLHKRLTTLIAVIIVFQSLALVIVLFVTQIFDMLDAEAIRVLNNDTLTRVETLNKNLGNLIVDLSYESENLSSDIVDFSNKNNTTPDKIYLNDSLYNELSLLSTESILNILEANNVNSAFVVFNASNSQKDNAGAHSTIYVTNTAPDNFDVSNLVVEFGPTNIAKEYEIATGVRWALDVSKNDSGDNFDFYSKPIQASIDYKGSEIVRYGYWSTYFDLNHNNQSSLSYTLPLLDENGDSFGVIGFAINPTYFSQTNIPSTDLIFDNSFYTMSKINDNNLDLNWFLSSGVLANNYFNKNINVELKPTKVENLYTAKLKNSELFNTSVHKIKIYSDNSPFADENWTLSCFVPNRILRENSKSVRNTLIFSIALTTSLSLIAGFFLVYFNTRKISGLSSYVHGLAPFDEIKFKQTGFKEIDNLTTAVSTFNDSIINVSKTTSKLLELSLLPIGGYEVVESNKNVVLTDFLYELLKLEVGTAVTKEQWITYYSNLTKQVHSDYKDVYKFTDITTKQEYWLRIVQTKTQSGFIGVVLDVTEDINENIRLNNQLDYDILTGLYSQSALKRKVKYKISKNPNSIGAMIFIDLDNLKYMNDCFGHDWGDSLIITASNIFRYFEKYNAIVSRISGDEFAIYLHGYNDKKELREIFSKIYSHAYKFMLKTPDGSENKIRFTCGVSWYPENATNVIDLLRLSDFAMYEAKQKEKGKLYEFNNEYYNQMSYLLENRENINKLIDEELICFAFQPIVSLKTGDVFGYEALMRPLIANFKNPQEILAVATAQSKLVQLENLIISKAFKSIDENIDKIGDKKIFINSIPNEVVGLKYFDELKEKYSKYFDNVVIEIIETETREEISLKTKVDLFKKNGIKIAVDDFGNGFSNEVRILTLMPDIIKIDMELIQGIYADPDKQLFVKNLVDYCHTKNILVVAEGIECYKDLIGVMKLGMDFAQGFYLAKPNFEFTNISKEHKQEILDFSKTL